MNYFHVLTPCPDCGESLHEVTLDFDQPLVSEDLHESNAVMRRWCCCGYRDLSYNGEMLAETRDVRGEPWRQIYVGRQPGCPG